MSTALETKLREAEAREHLLRNMIGAAQVMNEAQIPPRSSDAKVVFDMLVRLPDQQTMRRHLREAAGTPTRRTYTTAARQVLAKEGKARPDGSYPIKDTQDVEAAVDDFNRSEGTEADRQHIIQAAKKVGATDALPEDWEGSTKRLQESAKGLRELGIPTIGPEGVTEPVRLREATTAAELAQHGIPILSDSQVAGQRHGPDIEQMGIPLLPEAPGTSALRRMSLTESETGRIIGRVS